MFATLQQCTGNLQRRRPRAKRQLSRFSPCRKGKSPARMRNSRGRLPARITLCSNTLAMTPPADPAAKLTPNPSARLREIPSVDELLARPRLAALAEKAGRAVVTQSSRAVLAELRDELKQELSATNDTNTARARDLAAALDPAAIESRIMKHVEASPRALARPRHQRNRRNPAYKSWPRPTPRRGSGRDCRHRRSLFESRIRCRTRRARQARRSHRPPAGATGRRGSRDCRQQQRRRRFPRPEHAREKCRGRSSRAAS